MLSRSVNDMDAREIAIMKYMDLRIKGFGIGLTESDFAILNSIPEPEWQAVRKAIVELGGTLLEMDA